MNLSAGRRTWEEASSPAAVHLARKYEQAWRDSDPAGKRPNLHLFLGELGASSDGPGARLALLRADMTLRWETGEKVGAQWYLDRYADLGEDTIVALVYEEFCLREEDDERPAAAEYLARYPQVAGALGRVLEIHDLVGSGTPATLSPNSMAPGRPRARRSFRKPPKQSVAFLWSKSWGEAHSRGFFWRGSASSPTARWRSRSHAAARESRRRWHGYSTPISCRSTRTGSTRPRACISCACLISAGLLWRGACRSRGSGCRLWRGSGRGARPP